MKKLWGFLKRVFNSVKGPAIEEGGQFFEEALESYAVKDPVRASALVSSLHAFVDTELEDLAKKTKTDVDDLSVEEIKAELQEFADRHNLTLQNFDAGTPND